MNLKIKDFSKIIESKESIYKKIIAYKFRGTLYLDEELFIESIYDFTQNINLSNKVNKKKKYKRILYTPRELGQSYFYRGYAFAKINNIKEAIKDFDKALKKTPYCIDYEFFRKLDGEAKDILEKQLKLLNLFSFK